MLSVRTTLAIRHFSLFPFARGYGWLRGRGGESAGQGPGAGVGHQSHYLISHSLPPHNSDGYFSLQAWLWVMRYLLHHLISHSLPHNTVIQSHRTNFPLTSHPAPPSRIIPVHYCSSVLQRISDLLDAITVTNIATLN